MSSSALSNKRPSAEPPAFDLDYSIHDFEVDPHRDSQFLFRRVEEVMLREGLVSGGRTLDVACGVGQMPVRIHDGGGEGWGIDASGEMLGLNAFVHPKGKAVLVRGLAEVLPFRDAAFDRVICQGSLDHFVQPEAFIAEAARILRPDGRVVIALANYESLSCRLGPRLQQIGRRYFGQPVLRQRMYWEPPLDHYHKGDLAFVCALGGRHLELERCYGISLLWLLKGWGEKRWGDRLDELPPRLAATVLFGLDGIARRVPALADMIVSVWRHRRATRDGG
jgi:SAM-dependent methyltransferase